VSRRFVSAVLLLAVGAPLGAQPNGAKPNGAPRLESADLWNLPNRNFFVCVTLKGDSTPARYADGTPVGARGAYEVRTRDGHYKGAVSGPTATDRMSCKPGEVRLDAHEALVTSAGVLQFHKGGQGYADARVPYGHILAADIVNGDAVATQRPRSRPPEWGAPSATADGGWDEAHRNGRGCEPAPGAAYRVTIVPQGSADALPDDWQYKPKQTGSRYAKYADAGPEQGDRSAHFAYLVWSWMLRGDGVTKSAGGGMVRALLRDGQPFYRCAVRPIDGVAYAPGSDREAGRVTAVYGKTRASADGPWVYGWAVWAHRPKRADGRYGKEILHMAR
jgi:hypothetical protein